MLKKIIKFIILAFNNVVNIKKSKPQTSSKVYNLPSSNSLVISKSFNSNKIIRNYSYDLEVYHDGETNLDKP
jgi:hypothetical protein